MIRWFKPVVFLACLIPLGLLGWKAYNGALGANPIEVITHATGDWTLRFLLITLSITPIRKLTGRLWLIRYRRMLGLFAFFYGTLHFLTYIWLDKFFDVHEMLHDIAKRKFITVGFTASTDLSQRDCGRDPLFVAGQGRHSPAPGIWSDSGGSARVPGRSVGKAEAGCKQSEVSSRAAGWSSRGIESSQRVSSQVFFETWRHCISRLSVVRASPT
jgi:hypothetical protein